MKPMLLFKVLVTLLLVCVPLWANPTVDKKVIQYQASFNQEFDEAVDWSERAQAVQAFAYRLADLRKYSANEVSQVLMDSIASRINRYPNEAGSSLFCVLLEDEYQPAMPYLKSKNLLSQPASEAIRSYAQSFLKEREQIDAARYHHLPEPTQTAKRQTDSLQPGWTYADGDVPKICVILKKIGSSNYQVVLQELESPRDPKKPKFRLIETTRTGRQLLADYRYKQFAGFCAACKGSGSISKNSELIDCDQCAAGGMLAQAKPVAPAVAAFVVNPSNLAEARTRAKGALDQHNYDLAIQIYSQMLEVCTTNDLKAIAYGARGYAKLSRRRGNDLVEAGLDYRNAQKADPSYWEALFNASLVDVECGYLFQAESALVEARKIATSPGDRASIEKQLSYVRSLRPSNPATTPQTSGGSVNASSGGYKSNSMGGWRNADELRERILENHERQRRENAERASQHPNRKY